MRRRGPSAAAIAILALALVAGSAPQEPSGQDEPRKEEVFGRGSALGSAPSGAERVQVEEGTPLLAYPDRLAPQVEVAPAGLELPVLERRGDWVAVRYRALKVWLATTARPETPDFELPALPDHDRRLRQARDLLGAAERVRPLGPFTLYTDVEDDRLLERLTVPAADLARVYEARYGLRPRLLGNETIVLFRAAEDYQRHEEADSAIGGLETHGHASAALAILSAGGRGPDRLRQLLLHELTHLLNRRALARELPPWLEEGLAEDLSYSALDRSGRLDPARLGGRGTFMGAITSGSTDASWLGVAAGRNPWGSSPRASLAWLLHNWKSPDRLPIETLLELPWTAFVESGRRNFRYPESGFLVRYLVDEESGLARRFKSLLAEIAAGEEATPELVFSTLGVVPSRLEEGYYSWLWREAAANGVPRPVG